MSAPSPPKVYQVRTLRYNLPQLILVSALMVLSTTALSLVCYNLVPNIKPVLLDRVGASATDIALIIGSLPQAINFFLCPLVSTLSDKTRTRWGRRIPYLLFSAPVLVAILLAIGWSPEIAGLLQRLFPSLQGGRVALWVLAVLILLFQVAYLFPGSVVYYLIADVIPEECMGRFMSISAIAGSAVGAAFNLFILKYAVEYTKIVFCIIGALYLLVYILLAIFVKEGEYPPVQDNVDSSKNIFSKGGSYLTMFFRQCFSRKIFILLFLCTGLNQASNICRSMYNILFATKEIGIAVGTYGKICGYSTIISLTVIFFLGKIMDKTHPMLIYFLGGVFIMVVNVFGFFFVHTTMTFAVIAFATSIMYGAQGLAQAPLLISILPREQYGQFASANSMVNSVAVLIGAWLGGRLTDIFGYRVMFVWDFCVTLLAMTALIGVYHEWKRYGGKAAYAPPPVN